MTPPKIAAAIWCNGRSLKYAIETVEAFSRFFSDSRDYETAWVMMFASGREQLDGATDTTYRDAVISMRNAAGTIPVCVIDDRTTEAMRAAVPDGVPDPLGDRPNYGGAKNLSHIVAVGHGAEFLARVDPGIHPPAQPLDTVMHDVLKHLTPHKSFTSGQYVNRIALRYKQVPQGRRAQFLHLGL
jgi:hypothetical protein